MKAYILAVAGAVLLSAAISVLLPSGKMGKFVRGMVQLLVFSIVVAPLVSLIAKKDLSLFPAAQIGTDEGYLTGCAKLLSERDEEEIAAYILAEFSLNADAEVSRGTQDGFPLQKIKVNLSPDGINGQEGHIHIAERLRTALEEKFDCPPEIVEVSWSSG